MQLFVRGGTVLLLLGDVITFIAALVVTLFVRYQEVPSQMIIDQHLTPFTFLFILWVVVFLIAGFYDRSLLLARKEVPLKVLKVQSVNMLLAAAFFFAFPVGIEPKTNLVIYLIISSLGIAVWRLYIFPMLVTDRPLNILLIGDRPEVDAVVDVFASNPHFQNIRTYVLGKEYMQSESYLRSSLLTVLAGHQINIIVADMQHTLVEGLAQDFYTTVFTNQDIQFFDLAEMYEKLHHRIPPESVEEMWFLKNVTTQPHYAYDFLKRIIDVVGSLILFIPCIIIFPIVFVAIKLQDGGPTFYVSTRVGQYNRPTRIFKFRTMTGMDSGDTLDTKHAVTRLGKILRKTRIDELPQLWNVLRGDLSFIGPRPELPARAGVYAEEIPYYNMRHLIKPGLSGWAQINNFEVPRGEVDVKRTVDKLAFDLYYLKHRSIVLDIEVALKTIGTILGRTGT